MSGKPLGLKRVTLMSGKPLGLEHRHLAADRWRQSFESLKRLSADIDDRSVPGYNALLACCAAAGGTRSRANCSTGVRSDLDNATCRGWRAENNCCVEGAPPPLEMMETCKHERPTADGLRWATTTLEGGFPARPTYSGAADTMPCCCEVGPLTGGRGPSARPHSRHEVCGSPPAASSPPKH